MESREMRESLYCVLITAGVVRLMEPISAIMRLAGEV
jgi:hypothetical protein